MVIGYRLLVNFAGFLFPYRAVDTRKPFYKGKYSAGQLPQIDILKLAWFSASHP